MLAIRKNTFFIGGFVLLALIAVPIALYYSQKPQQAKSNAEKTVDLSYDPSFPQTASSSALLQLPAGTTFTLDVYVDPGANSVSLVKLDMTYDPTKFTPAGGFIPNQSVFSQVVEGPVETPGQVTATLSIGSNLSNALKVKTKVGTLALKVLDNAPASTTSTIGFGSDSQALSVSSNSSYDENVIANTTPVTVQINKPQTSCGTSPGDSMLVMDTSGSMSDQDGTSGTKISNAISAADNYINIVAGEANNRVGLVNFATTATLDSPLTSTFSTVTSQVNALKANGNTCLQCGIDKANQEITTDKRENIKNAVIILTDGLANAIEGNSNVSEATAEQAALTAATNGHSANGTVYYTIGLGQDVDSTFLTNLAESTGGQYYFSPTTDQLNDIYSQISQILAGGSVSGIVFNDVNDDGIFEPTEPGIPGVLLQLYALNSSTPQQLISTDSDGTYTMQNICDGTYTLKQMIPNFWNQTLPSDPGGYTFTITNGSSVTDKNFGDKESAATPTPSPDPTPTAIPTPTLQPTAVPTATPKPTAAPTLTPQPSLSPSPSGTPSGTRLALNVLLDGIGNAGDNANPTASSLSNKTPAHPTRNATAQIFDVNNNLVATASGDIHYSSASGSFIGTVYITTPIIAGSYTIKVRSDYHLTRLVPGVVQLLPNKVNQIPTVELVAGDANNDNQLNILDYNLLLGCYSDFAPATNCNATTQLETDFNDDGSVNEFDYNLFLRELSTQPGD